MNRVNFYIGIIFSISFVPAYGQFSNMGANIVGKGNVLFSSSMDLHNEGEFKLLGTLELKGERKIESYKPVVVDEFNLTDLTILEGDIFVNKNVDFGLKGLVKIKENNALTFGPGATYTNYSNGKGIHGTIKKVETNGFIFPLGTNFEAFPLEINESQVFAEASLHENNSIELGDFNEEGLIQPNLAVVNIKTSNELSASNLNLKFDEQKNVVILDNGIWKEASNVPIANSFVATKAFSYNRASALESSESKWLQVFPNPSSGEININMSAKDANLGDVSFRIVDLKGAVINEEIKEGKNLIGKYKFPDNLINGTYLLEFEHENGKRAVVKQIILR